MKIVGAKDGNKNVKMIFGEKMMLCNDEIYWGKIATTNLPLRPLTTPLDQQKVVPHLDHWASLHLIGAKPHLHRTALLHVL